VITVGEPPRLVGVEGSARFDSATGSLELVDVRGERGTAQRARVLGAAGVRTVTVNGRSVAEFAHDAPTASTDLTVRFGGAPFNQSQEVAGCDFLFISVFTLSCRFIRKS